jgi:hypothetical protein
VGEVGNAGDARTGNEGCGKGEEIEGSRKQGGKVLSPVGDMSTIDAELEDGRWIP